MANFTPNQNEYNNMTPFKTWLKYQINTWGLNSFPFVESDFDDLTNYAMMMKLMKHFNVLIENQNMVEEDMTKLYNAFTELQTYLFDEFADYKTELNTSFNEYKNQVDGEIEQFETSITSDFNNLQNYVDNFFDNNFPQMISDKLDEMAQDGTLENLLNDTAHLIKVYNTHAEMIADSSTFTNGLRVMTMGYYSINDGGNAKYIVTNIENTNKIQIELTNNLYLELIIDDGVNVKQIGAYGDNTHDDSTTLQSAFNFADKYKIIIPDGTYLISTSLSLTGNNIFIDGENANLKYTGNDYAITSNYLRYSTIKIGDIESTNGGCIKFNVTSSDNQFVYDNIYFRTFKASTSCVLAHCTGGGWINEIRWFNGKLMSGNYGFNIEHDHTGQWANNAINGWHFNNIGVEGVTTGFYLNAISGRITQFDFNGLRNAESFTTLLKTSGTVDRCSFIGSNLIEETWLDLSANTNIISLLCPVRINNHIHSQGYINGGLLTGIENMNNLLETGMSLSASDDLNNIVIPGTYTSNNNAITQGISNKPSEISSGPFKLIVNEMTNIIRDDNSTYSYLQQTIYHDENIYMRKITIDNGTKSVGSWNKLQTSIIPFLLEGGTLLTSSTDLNNVIKPGTYTSNANWMTQGISNKPSDITGGTFKLIVIETTNLIRESNPDTAYLIQIFITTGGSTNLYYRKIEISNHVATVGSWKGITSS